MDESGETATTTATAEKTLSESTMADTDTTFAPIACRGKRRDATRTARHWNAGVDEDEGNNNDDNETLV